MIKLEMLEELNKLEMQEAREILEMLEALEMLKNQLEMGRMETEWLRYTKWHESWLGLI